MSYLARHPWRSILALAVLVAGCAATPAPPAGSSGGSAGSSASTRAALPSSASTGPTSSSQLASQDFTAEWAKAVARVSKQVKPTVVQITNEQVNIGQLSGPALQPASVGSGVTFRRDGQRTFVLANDHVVADAQRLAINAPDGHSFPAKITGRDTQTDLAVLELEAPDLPVAQLGDCLQMEVGDWVVAIGSTSRANRWRVSSISAGWQLRVSSMNSVTPEQPANLPLPAVCAPR